jgi:hypothetical protein
MKHESHPRSNPDCDDSVRSLNRDLRLFHFLRATFGWTA